MAYGHQYINEFKQFGVISYTLRLIDDEGIMPVANIPIVVRESDLSEQHLEDIAFSLKTQHTTRYLESIVVPTVEEPEIITVVDSLSSEEFVPVLEETDPTTEETIPVVEEVAPVVEESIPATEEDVQPETPIEII